MCLHTRGIVALAILAIFSSVPLCAAPAPAPQARTIAIQTGDNMKFSVTQIAAAPGERLRIVLAVTGTMSKSVMGHNLVILRNGTNAAAFVNVSAMARNSGFVAPATANQILAATALAGGGETVEVTFDVPRTLGSYEFVCTFPGHYLAGMKGVLVVK